MAEAGRENVDASNVLEFESSGELNPIIARLISNGIPIGLDGIDNPLIYTLSEASTVGSEFLPSLRKRYMSNQLQKHQECFTSFTPYDLWIGSWNVAGIEGENFEALRPWMDFESLHNNENEPFNANIAIERQKMGASTCNEESSPTSDHGKVKGQKLPDFCFFSLQEIDRRAEAYVITSTARECNWNTTLLSCLQNIANKQNQSYVFVASVSLVGIYGSFFARKECVDRIKDVQRCRVGCGLMGFMANKGGVGLRVRIDDEYIVLVSSHLAAHTQNVSKRNYEYADLCKRMHFTREDCFMPKISLEEINHPNIKNFNSKSTKELADSSTNHSTSQSDMKETSSSSSGETNTNNVIKINADDSVFAFDLTNSHIDNENFDQKKSSNPILKIINQWIDRPSMAAGLAAFEENELKCVRTIFDGGFLFWAGDLNYRLDLDLEETKLLARERRYEELFRYDQLCVQQAAGLAFSIFLEGDSDYQRLTHQYIDAAYQAALAADAELFESLIIHSDPKTVSQKIDESSSESPTFSTEINVYLGKNNIEDSKSANSDLEHISNLMETVNVHSRHEKTTGSSLGNSESTEIQCKNDADLNVLNCEPHADFNSRFEKSNHNVNNLVSSNEASTSQFNDSSQESVNRFNHHINSKALTNSTLNSIKHNIYSKIDAPSFKYIPGTIHFDEGPKGRAPAWADRILHRKGDRTTCVRNPKTILEVLSSDHKPVCAQYQIEVAKINHDIFRSLIEGCMTNMDTFENDAIPKMVVSDNLVDLGCLVWGRPACQVIQITNVGNVFTKFSFGDSTDDESNTVPNWIFINPNSGILPPATSIKISINALLGPGTFDQFKHFRKPQYPNETEVNKNSNSLDNLSHILVMHVSGGSDHFISVDYSIRRSSPFGKSLIELSELEGLTAILPDWRKETGNQLSFEKIPKSFVLLVDFLVKFVKMNEASPDVLRSLFLLPASGDRVDMIVDSIDTNSLTPDIDLCINMNLEDGLAASECLLRLLDSLNEPLIPYSIFESTLATSADLKMEVEHLLAHIPHSHFELIQYLVHLIKWMNNFIKSDLREIATALAPVLIKQPPPPAQHHVHPHKMRKTSLDAGLLHGRRIRFVLHLLN